MIGCWRATRLVTPKLAPYAKPVYHLYVVQVPDRKKQQAAFDAANVSHVIHYPIPVHLQPAFAELGYKPGSFPVMRSAGAEDYFAADVPRDQRQPD